MKNFLKVSVLALVLVLVSGCGSSNGKVLTCTMNEEESGMKMANTVKMTFEKDKATKVNMVIKITLDEQYKSYMSMFKSAIDAQYADIKDEKGVSYKTDTKGSVVTFTIDADLAKMSDKAKEKLDFGDATGSYADNKKAAEKSGFKCK